MWAGSIADDAEVVPPFECPIGSRSPARELRDVPDPAKRPLDMECGSSTPLFLTRLDASLRANPTSRPTRSGIKLPHSIVPDMPRPRSTQELMHWLEMGGGARLITVAAALLGLLGLSLLVAWKQFHGATSEAALVQADVGRQLVRGEGFSTLVNYPQTAAFMERRGVNFDPLQAYPELYQAPLYSLVIAGALRVLPAAFRASLFDEAPVTPDGFGGDYLLLGINLVLLWLTAWLTFDLGRRLFDARVVGFLPSVFSCQSGYGSRRLWSTARLC